MRFSTQAMAVLTLLVGGASSANAGFTVYTSRSDFEAAISGLTKQDFSAAQVADGSQALITGPLTSTSNNGVFKPGDIAPGLSIESTGSSPDGNKLYIPGVGTVGNDVRAVYTNGSNATLGLTFSPQVDAVGLTLLSFTDNKGPRTFTLSLLGSFSTTPMNYSTGPLPETGSGTFLGFIGTGGSRFKKLAFNPRSRLTSVSPL